MNLAGETEVLGGNLPRRHFVHHKIPHDRPGVQDLSQYSCDSPDDDLGKVETCSATTVRNKQMLTH
jgi:hypothetical protein